jgi:hypothetical protein
MQDAQKCTRGSREQSRWFARAPDRDFRDCGSRARAPRPVHRGSGHPKRGHVGDGRPPVLLTRLDHQYGSARARGWRRMRRGGPPGRRCPITRSWSVALSGPRRSRITLFTPDTRTSPRGRSLDVPGYAVVVLVAHPSADPAPVQRVHLDAAAGADRQGWAAHRQPPTSRGGRWTVMQRPRRLVRDVVHRPQPRSDLHRL